MAAMKHVIIFLIVLVVVLDLAFAEGDETERPGRRNRNRNRNRDKQRNGNGGRRAEKSRGCKYERPQTKAKDLCQSTEPVTITLNLNATARNDANCAATKQLTYNCSKVCKYENRARNARPACDTATNTKTITLSLKTGMPSWCPATSEKKKPCSRRRRPREADAVDAREW